MVGSGSGSAKQAAVPATTSPATSTDAAVSTAQRAATTSGEPVVVDELTTPTELTTAMPDGTLQYEASSQPVRVRKQSNWVPVDTDLVRVGEWWVPAATASPVRFSPGGDDMLAQVQDPATDAWVSEVWPYGVLPTPAVEADTATYAEVFPGVDLKLVVTKTGMASIYVVKSEQAALSAPLAKLHVAVEGATLERSASGAVIADTGGSLDAAEVLVAGAPLWWDSSEGGTYREPGGESPLAPVEHTVTTDRLSMNVGASVQEELRLRAETSATDDILADPVVYPIFVDPDWSTGINSSWYTDAAYPNQSYLSAGASDRLRVGIYQQYRSDMFYEFPLAGVKGKQVLSARLNTTQLAVAACGAQAISVHAYGYHTPGFTWNQEQAWNAAGTGGWTGALQSWTGPDCGSPAMAVGWNVTSGVQGRLAGGSNAIQLAFTYVSPTAPSRRHYSRAATLVVTYNTPPSTPTGAKFSSPDRPCGTSTAPTMIGQTNVTVAVDQRDPDPGNVDTNFYLAKASSLGTVLQNPTGGLAAQGPKYATFTALTNGTTYAWRARGSDWKIDGTAYSAWCYFTVDTTKPATPTLTSSASTFTVGTALSVNATGSSDGAGYVYWVSPGAVTSTVPPVPIDGTVSAVTALPSCDRLTANVRWACASGSTPKSLNVAPVDSLSALWVSAYDTAGNQSAAAGFPLYPNGNTATPAAPADLNGGHAWQLTTMTSPLPAVISDSNPWAGTAGIDLTLPPTAAKDVTDLPEPPFESPVIDTNTADEPQTSSAAIDTSKSFTLSMWVKAASISSVNSQMVAVQYGAETSTIQLQITRTGLYAFCFGDGYASADSVSMYSNCAVGGTVLPGQWQLVTGIWDAANQQLRVLVDNSIKPAGSTSHVQNFSVIGSGPLFLGPTTGSLQFHGYITNPVAVPGVVDHNQLAQLAGFFLPFS